MSSEQIQGLQLVVVFSITLTLITPAICWGLSLPVDESFTPFESMAGDVSNIIHQILP